MSSESAANEALAASVAARTANVGRHFATPGPSRVYPKPGMLARVLAAIFNR